MAKKNLAGQINMFDVFRDLEKNAETSGKVEMVSLVPEREPVSETDVEIAPEKNETFGNVDGCGIKKNSDIAMHREKRDAYGDIVAEISYINYNKVLIRRKGHEDILKSFDNSYDAVDYYVSNMRLDNF